MPLIGETHKEVVSLLKELPVCVCLVCSRIVPPSIPDSDEEDDADVHLSLKELLAEFNDKVGAKTVEGMNRRDELLGVKSLEIINHFISITNTDNLDLI